MNKIKICIFFWQFSNNCHMAYFYATFTVLFNAVCWHWMEASSLNIQLNIFYAQVKSPRFQTTLMWVNDDRIYTFG